MPDRHSDVILKRLLALHPKVIDLSLDRMQDILAKMDHPEEKLPPVIHVAGTNGKGSLIAYLRAMLEAAGYRVHVYTSPHLVKFAERIVLAGEIIPEAELSDLLLECETINGPDPITYFEVTTAAAFLAFSRVDADILLLETGLGGRLDATNMVASPAVTALTPISHDHEQFLGTDLSGIAGEKAGIIKSGRPVVVGPQIPVVSAVIEQQASALNAPIYAHDSNWHCNNEGDKTWRYEGGNLSGTYDNPALNGVHQTANAATAIAVLEKLDGFTVTSEHVSEGLQSVYWPARLQRLTHGPLSAQLTDDVEIWLDGGHNVAAAQRIRESFQAFNAKDDKPTYLICGMMAGKDQLGYLRQLQQISQKAVMVDIDGENGASSANDLAAVGLSAGIDSTAKNSAEDAVDYLLPLLVNKPCRLLIAGSLYLSGQILRENG
jgi:dihydrofolate synthase / folylpolyglutamate synthase